MQQVIRVTLKGGLWYGLFYFGVRVMHIRYSWIVYDRLRLRLLYVLCTLLSASTGHWCYIIDGSQDLRPAPPKVLTIRLARLPPNKSCY